jgi:hypothetical protein
MANEIAEVVIGDYRYKLFDDGTARALTVDKTKSSYGELRTSITYEGATYAMTDMNSCFWGCENLESSPAIPQDVTTMAACFYRCFSLVDAPALPDGVTNLFQCFAGCRSLTTVQSVPSGVTRVEQCFTGCVSLTGNIFAGTPPTSYAKCFAGTELPITIYVRSQENQRGWQQVAATGTNGNVSAIYPENNPAPTATLNVTRVGSDGSTVPNESGEWAYVQVETTVSTDQAPDNVARAPIITKDGSSVVPSTHASGTASYVDWVSLGDDKTHRIGATPRDLYKSGGEVIVTLAGTYSPMEFYTKPILDEHDEVIGYEGGVGASFGKHATREGVLDVAWDIESEGDVSADGALSCADGSPYCKSGTDVKVGGTTVGSADNLSYVASEDTLRVPTTHAATRHPTNTRAGSIYYTRCGRLVMVSFSLDVTATTNNAVIATGLPKPQGSDWFVVAGAGSNQVVPMYVSQSTGELRLNAAHDARWWVGTTVYVSAS